MRRGIWAGRADDVQRLVADFEVEVGLLQIGDGAAVAVEGGDVDGSAIRGCRADQSGRRSADARVQSGAGLRRSTVPISFDASGAAAV